jgi:hypothetical protein
MPSSFPPLGWLLAFAARLRFPQLFLLTAAMFILDLLIPDVIPFADEVLLGLTTALLGSIRGKNPEPPAGAEPPEGEEENGDQQ